MKKYHLGVVPKDCPLDLLSNMAINIMVKERGKGGFTLLLDHRGAKNKTRLTRNFYTLPKCIYIYGIFVVDMKYQTFDLQIEK